MLERLNKAPFPWYGGKSQAAPLVWSLLGDVMHYVEPFAGSMAVLLERPHPCNRTYYSETINDLDGFVVNAWRAIQWHPEATAEAASWPVSELDKQARQIAVLKWYTEAVHERLAGSATWCDPQMAGWWLYGVCCQIGPFHGRGPWTADPVTGRIVKTGQPGISRNRPPLITNGNGANRPQLREPGIWRNLPQLSDNGRGINRPQLREPGVSRNRPHLSDNGMGVNHAGLREPGVSEEAEFHPVTMPELLRWFRWLAARLRHVRIVAGDWQRICTDGARLTLSVRQGDGYCGVFLDPPYSCTERDRDLYRIDQDNMQQRVRDWCLHAAQQPQTRIVLAGYDTEHTALEAAGWTVHEWYAPGFLRGGYGNIDGTSQQHRERLWASPHCLEQHDKNTAQMNLFAPLSKAP